MKLNKHGYPLIESEEQYWEEFKKWKKRFKKARKRFRRNPISYVQEMENLLNEAVDRDLLEKEDADRNINRMYRELNIPNEFKDDIGKAKQYVRKKLKQSKEALKREKKEENGEKS